MFAELVGEESFFKADWASRRVVGSETVEQAAVSEDLVAAAVTGLLRQQAGDLAGNMIRPSNISFFKLIVSIKYSIIVLI